MTDQSSSAPALPTCPRHPDRVALVSCQRCGRPTCPECQRPAPVGIQCVDCVNEGAKSVRTAGGIFGGTVTRGNPVVTYTLIGICAVVWLIQKAVPTFTQDIWFAPVQFGSQPWRTMTAAFAHSEGSIFHIVFNMYALWICGQYLEPLLGRVRFAALYLISAFGGSVGYMLLASTPRTLQEAPTSGWFTPTVGASGAVFGLFLALVVLNRHLGRDYSQIIVLIVINAVLGFVVGGIAWQAHLGGAITGGVCAGIYTALKKRPPVQWAALAGVVVVLIALAVWRYQTADVPSFILHAYNF